MVPPSWRPPRRARVWRRGSSASASKLV
jgi:hypothetical protein